MKGLKIFNSQTRKKEVFRPDSNKKVGIYVCGITPYDVTHLGHAFTYVFFDVLIRYLKFLGYKVIYVQNLTDIDDDILKEAAKLRKDWREVVRSNSQKFLEETKWLNNLQPDFYPHAADHIKEIIEIVQKLQKRGFAYEKKGNVYFSIKKDKEYGKLSRLSKKRMLPIANERGNNPNDPNKKDPLDFVLWQAKKPKEPSWPSPWGEGRPGWHIECSAMSQKYLGKTIDIYGGGSDLIFPHHESSIAQSEKVTGQPLARYWLHTGMLRYRRKKMSKSLGNLILIDDLRKIYSANTVRLLLLSHHYRSVWEFFKQDIQKAEKAADLFKKVWLSPSGTGRTFDVKSYEKRFFEAMNNDFDTKKTISVLTELAKKVLNANRNIGLADAKSFLVKTFNILGLLIEYE